MWYKDLVLYKRIASRKKSVISALSLLLANPTEVGGQRRSAAVFGSAPNTASAETDVRPGARKPLFSAMPKHCDERLNAMTVQKTVRKSSVPPWTAGCYRPMGWEAWLGVFAVIVLGTISVRYAAFLVEAWDAPARPVFLRIVGGFAAAGLLGLFGIILWGFLDTVVRTLVARWWLYRIWRRITSIRLESEPAIEVWFRKRAREITEGRFKGKALQQAKTDFYLARDIARARGFLWSLNKPADIRYYSR